MTTATGAYPARLNVDFPEETNRWSSFFRLIAVIPIAAVMIAVGSALVGPTLLMILFRQKYPRWWFDFNVSLLRFQGRVVAYFLLLQHEYPSTDEEQGVHVDLDYPDAESDLVRWMPLVKWLLAIPLYILLALLGIGAMIAAVIAWFAILFTGTMPRGLFDYIVGVLRWSTRVTAYAFLLTTDRYPPFRLEE